MTTRDMDYFRSFREICKAVNSSLDLQEVLRLIVENVTAIMKVKACTIFLLNRKNKQLEVAATHGLSDAYLEKGPLSALRSMIENIEGRSVLVHDAGRDSRIQYPEEARAEGIASIYSVPVPVKNRVIGALRIYTAVQRDFSDQEREFVDGLAEMSGIAIENARLHHHLKADYETLIAEVHQWFEYGAAASPKKSKVMARIS